MVISEYRVKKTNLKQTRERQNEIKKGREREVGVGGRGERV